METFVSCLCGHALATHDAGDCAGERLRPCRCKRDRNGALEAAVSAVRAPMAALYGSRPVAGA